MKNVFPIALAIAFFFISPAEAQLKMDSNGDVGIGNITGDLAYRLQVRGTAQFDDLVEEGKNKFGVIAQELKEILPDLVIYDEETELYGVNYIEMIPILVEAIKDH